MNALPAPFEQPASKSPPLRFYLLGSPIVVWQDTVLAISRRVVRALLYRLACDSTAVAREHLHLLFWPDIPQKAARRNLSHVLTHLRRALPSARVLAASQARVWLEPGQVWCDALALRQAASDPCLDPDRLSSLIGLYRGPFLEDFDLPGCPEFEYWCLVERIGLDRHYLRLLGQLIEHCTGQGEIRQAIRYARQYLETDNLSEPMHQRLIQLYAASGERHLALKQFEDCASILAGELSVEPLPETRAIYLAVLSGQQRFPVPAAPPRTPGLPEGEIPLIGRENELRILADAFAGLETEASRVVLLSGEAGIGKTRLMREFAGLQRGRAQPLFGSSHPGEMTIPYQPVVEIVRAILGLDEPASAKPSLQARLKPAGPDFSQAAWLTEVSRLIPEILARYPDLPAPLALEPESAQTRLFDALCRLILAYARSQGPILLCLDDLQWMDASSKAWLAYIARYLKRGRHPLLILGAYRQEEYEAIQDLRNALMQARLLIEIRLDRLDEQAVYRLVRALLGGPTANVSLARQLHQATGGNPFYLIETVNKQIEEGRLVTASRFMLGSALEPGFQQLLPLALPESVRDAIQARLRLLSPIARQLLEAGSVLGQSFGVDLLRLTAGRSHAETMLALEELVSRVLLVENQTEYRFIHELTRQHVADNLGRVRKQLLHLRAGRTLLRLAPEAYPNLAHHFEQGGDLSRALHFFELAAQRAKALYAWQEVDEHQGRMLALLATLDPLNTQPDLISQRGSILADRAHTRHLSGRRAGRDGDLQALYDLGEACQDDRVRLLAILSTLRYLNLDGEYPQAIALAEKGLALIGTSAVLQLELEPTRRAKSQLLAQIGYGYYFLGQPAEALASLEEAWGLCDDQADPEARGRILHILGYVYLHLGDYQRSLECQQNALACHRQLGDACRMAWDLLDIGVLHLHMLELAQARQFLAEGLELSHRVGSQQAEAYGLAYLGKLDLYQGDYQEAAGHFQQVFGMQRGSPSEHILATAEAGIGFACYHLGDYTQSRPWLERALQRARATSHRRRTAKTLIQLGMLDTVEDSLTSARWNLVEGLSVAQDCQSGECLAAGLAALARLERLAGDPECALEIALEAVRSAQLNGLVCCEMWGEIELSLDYLALQNLPAALEHASRAVSLSGKACQDWIHREEAERVLALVRQAACAQVS